MQGRCPSHRDPSRPLSPVICGGRAALCLPPTRLAGCLLREDAASE